MILISVFGFQSQACYSIPMLVLNHKFGIGSEFPRSICVFFIFVPQAWSSIPMLVLNHMFGIESQH